MINLICNFCRRDDSRYLWYTFLFYFLSFDFLWLFRLRLFFLFYFFVTFSHYFILFRCFWPDQLIIFLLLFLFFPRLFVMFLFLSIRVNHQWILNELCFKLGLLYLYKFWKPINLTLFHVWRVVICKRSHLDVVIVSVAIRKAVYKDPLSGHSGHYERHWGYAFQMSDNFLVVGHRRLLNW